MAACKCRERYPGQIVALDSHGYCAKCGGSVLVYQTVNMPESKWDNYFHGICVAVSSKSSCLSRQIGAVLVKDHSIVSTGYNGPPRGIPHCGVDRFRKDKALRDQATMKASATMLDKEVCLRKVMDYKSGEGMQWCPAQHAEENAVSNAARLGVSTVNTTLYMNSVIPCQKCYGTLINAGITNIVVDIDKVYDKHSQFLIDNSNIPIRSFSL